MFASTQDFIQALSDAGELHRVKRRASAVLDIAAIADQESKARAPHPPSEAARAADPTFWDRGGRALLFERVEGSDFPLLVNALGSYRRMEMALGCHDKGRIPGGFDAIAARIASLTKPVPPRNLTELVGKAREFLPLLGIMPRLVGSAPCQEVVIEGKDVDLTRLPILKCWPLDGDLAAVGYPANVNEGVKGLGHPDIPPNAWDASHRGRFITFAGIHTIHHNDLGDERPGSHNIGMYRVQLHGQQTLSMHWHMHHDGARHWRSWKKAGDRMPVAIVLGGESVMPYAATCPLPPGISELLMAGFLNGKGIPLVWGRTVPIRVPANAEIVIEGWVDTRAGFPGWDPREAGAGPLGPGAVFEGPFGDHTGFYSMPDRYPLVHVTAITHRVGAVYPTTIVGLPPQEDYYMGKATERVMGALLKVVVHDIEDYDLPMFGAFHNCAFLRIHKEYPLQGRRLMASVWGAGQMAWTKCLFIVDDDIDVHDASAVLTTAARLCRPDRDLVTMRGPLDILDHAAPHFGAGSKVGFDCTRKWVGEQAGSTPTHDADGNALPEAIPGTAASEAATLDAVRALPGVLEATIRDDAPGWLLVRVDRGLDEPDAAHLDFTVTEQVLAIAPARPDALPFVLVLGRDVDLTDPVAPFFHWLANMDPGRDMVLAGNRVGFACSPKTPEDARRNEPVRAWPPVLVMDVDADGRATELRKREGLLPG
jgi:4-hydroxy-3-polyprenylbenzoate decarboxylase